MKWPAIPQKPLDIGKSLKFSPQSRLTLTTFLQGLPIFWGSTLKKVLCIQF